jgi:hypothetical protein
MSKKWRLTERTKTLLTLGGFSDLPSREPTKAKFFEGELCKCELENILLPVLEKG